MRMPLWSDEPVILDRHDTLHSARGKLESGAPGRPVVVLDSHCRIAESPLTYQLLARTQEQIGSPIAVVTGNPHWRKLARERGLRAYSSVGALNRSRRRSAVSFIETTADLLVSALNVSFSRQGWAILAILSLVVGVAVYYFLPVMKVTIQTPVEEIRQDIVARVDVGLSSLDVSSSTVPGRVMEHRFSVSETVSTTSEKNVGKEKARGEVTVLNTSSSLVTIPAGTVLSTGDGRKFSTMTTAVVGAFLPASATPRPVPTASPSTGPVPTATPTSGTSVKIPIMALEAGEKGNVPALAVSRFESETLKNLTVFNEQALAGGTEAKTKVASAEDRSRLKEALFQRAQTQALSELQVRVRQSESLVPHSMQVRIEREDYDRALDEEADKLKGTLSVVASLIAFANSDLNTLVEKQWKASIPKGFRPMPGPLGINPPEVTQAAAQTASLRIRVAGKAERVFEADELTQALRGLSLKEAQGRLGQQENLRLVKLEMWPDWAPKAIRVEVQTVQ